ncbi:hypothetical protein ACF3NV_00740 [Moraxella atlantae]|uniref:hypothetical protein n=1 Tax=Faucicola atlantae TaxID=34059 RepID=UPI00375112E9
MGKMADSLRQRANEYISFKALLIKVSSDNQKPLYYVASYLLHHGLHENLGCYTLDADYTVVEDDDSGIEIIYKALRIIKLKLTYKRDWIFTIANLEQLKANIERTLDSLLLETQSIYFKKSEIASFEPLKDLLTFDDLEKEPSKPNPFIFAHDILTNDNLPPVTADKIGHATITQTTPTDSQLSQQLADQQATIDRQAKQIAELEAQIIEQQKTIEQLTEQAAAPTNYTTPALEALAAVIDEFWVSYDPSQPKTAQKQVYIKAWILENHPDLNPSIALWLDKIARHPTAK